MYKYLFVIINFTDPAQRRQRNIMCPHVLKYISSAVRNKWRMSLNVVAINNVRAVLQWAAFVIFTVTFKGSTAGQRIKY